MQEEKKSKSELVELSNLYLFEEVYKFVRESTGITITSAYLVLLLSSMAYIHVFYSAFDIQIVKYVTFEDILAAPIKNPDIIFAFFALILLLYVVDVSNRFRARQRLNYVGKEKTFFYKIVQVVFWTPRQRKVNLKVTALTMMFFLGSYIFALAKTEAQGIKQGEGQNVEITFADSGESIKPILLGTSLNYVFTYDPERQESIVYYVESIKSLKSLETQVNSTPNQADNDDTERTPEAEKPGKD